ncbi:MAG: DAK2 domain-containing protein [Selenomonadaceae bacterium]|nr:DAK2 domain-containing protein [Selenomonadaceae bacterium]
MNTFENIVGETGESQEDIRQGEVITGSDFKRMVRGVYSELLLAAENIDDVERRLRPGSLRRPGRDLCRTMAPAAQLLARSEDDSIGGLSRLAASASFLGARGSAGVMLASILRGLAKGLSGCYDATDSQVGRAFQYGILYAQRALVVEEEEPDEVIVQAARAVAKSAHDAVRANLSILEILSAAKEPLSRLRKKISVSSS